MATTVARLCTACLHLNCDDFGYRMKQAFVETGGFGPQQAERDTIRIQRATNHVGNNISETYPRRIGQAH